MLPNSNCFMLLMQEMPCARILAFAKAGNSMAARIAIMAITTSSSISVKPWFLEPVFTERPLGKSAHNNRFIIQISTTFNSHITDRLYLKTPFGSQPHLDATSNLVGDLPTINFSYASSLRMSLKQDGLNL